MFRNYIKSSINFLKKNKLFTIINTIGLSLALGVSFIILLYVINEFTYNNSHKNKDKVFRVINYHPDFKMYEAGSPYVLASTLKNDYPQVEKATQTRRMRGFQIKKKNEVIDIHNCLASGSDIFQIFTIPLVQASSNLGLLDDKYSIALSESLAQKLFNDIAIIGQELECIVDDETQVFVVSSIYKDISSNSTIKPACMINSCWTLPSMNENYSNAAENWSLDSWDTWVCLNNKKDHIYLNEELKSSMLKYQDESYQVTYSLQNLSDIYLKSSHIINSGESGNLQNIKLYFFIACAIILLAGLNYVLLSTTVSISRTKEIGIRKTNGASTSSIQTQLFIESILLTFMALPISIVLFYLAIPFIGNMFDKELHIINNNIWIYLCVYLGITVIIGFVSGLYSAFYLSKLRIVNIFKRGLSKEKGSPLFRTSLIIAELIIFCCFITSVLTIRAQHQYFLTKEPGYNTENILFLNLGRNFKSYDPLLNDIRSNNLITNAAGCFQQLPMRNSMSLLVPHYDDPENKVTVEGMAVDFGFIETMGIEVCEGRSFSNEFTSDIENAMLINETAVKALGIEDPIGKKFLEEFTIIGVLKDFNLHALYSDIPPLYIHISPKKHIGHVSISYKKGHYNEVLTNLENIWKNYGGESPLDYSTVEQITQELYQTEENLITIISFASFFTLIISSMGLLGLTLFLAKSRTKEIGIKKVLGSSEQSIIYFFLKKNLLAVVIASVIATPISYYLMSRWLSSFAYHISINYWYFILSGLFAMLLVSITVFINSYKTATKNPVEALRYE